MAKKRSIKTTPRKPPTRIAATIVRALVITAIISASVAYGKHGIPAARQDGCERGGQAVLAAVSGQQADPEKLTTFCKEVLAK